jgi:hypothetical protein
MRIAQTKLSAHLVRKEAARTDRQLGQPVPITVQQGSFNMRRLAATTVRLLPFLLLIFTTGQGPSSATAAAPIALRSAKRRRRRWAVLIA